MWKVEHIKAAPRAAGRWRTYSIPGVVIVSNPVDDLAVEAKGDQSLMLPLWRGVERFVSAMAYRYHGTTETRMCDADDLMQCGYLSMVDAVAGFDPSRGMSFVGYLAFHLRRRFAEVMGRNGAKKRPEVGAVSLSITLGDDEGYTLCDVLPDPDAERMFTELVERASDERDVMELLADACLDDDERRTIDLQIFQGMSARHAAENMDATPERVSSLRDKALRKLRASKTARRLWRDYDTRHVGINEFRQTHSSEQEKWLLWNEAHENS